MATHGCDGVWFDRVRNGRPRLLCHWGTGVRRPPRFCADPVVPAELGAEGGRLVVDGAAVLLARVDWLRARRAVPSSFAGWGTGVCNADTELVSRLFGTLTVEAIPDN